LDHLWVEANLWESSLRGVRPGQPAKITVDLYGRSVTYHGKVKGLDARQLDPLILDASARYPPFKLPKTGPKDHETGVGRS
jgi:Cation efflux system protein CusB domain 1